MSIQQNRMSLWSITLFYSVSNKKLLLPLHFISGETIQHVHAYLVALARGLHTEGAILLLKSQVVSSLQPPLILALAMCARGEIGFLISGVAESNGIFSASGTASASESSDIFPVVTRAIVLCTILGPLGVGLSVRRVKKLQERKSKQQEGTGRDVLGVWGLE